MNSPFIWKDKYSLGIEEVDLQHQDLLEMVNHLWLERMSPMNRKAFQQKIREIIEFAQLHFETEESYFRKYDYPETQAHMIEHDFFRQKMNFFISNVKIENITHYLDEVIEFLEGWLIHHFMKVDQKYSDYMIKYGKNTEKSQE